MTTDTFTDTFKPKSWQAEVPDLVKEYEAWDKERTEVKVQDKPDSLDLKLVRTGRLNRKTGAYTPRSSKAQCVANFSPSKRFCNNYDKIHWNS